MQHYVMYEERIVKGIKDPCWSTRQDIQLPHTTKFISRSIEMKLQNKKMFNLIFFPCEIVYSDMYSFSLS
jgi:hypothetical protein